MKFRQLWREKRYLLDDTATCPTCQRTFERLSPGQSHCPCCALVAVLETIGRDARLQPMAYTVRRH